MRLALVCYGGVSLAVYMHGITKELHKLARASKTLHQPGCDVSSGYLENAHDLENRETDSETVYFELLRIIKQQLNLRVIVDVASGASAGGINALMLSRAISHDLPLDAHRQMWLKYADVTELMDDHRIPRAWNKWYMTPLVQRWSKTALKRLLNDKESQEKMSLKKKLFEAILKAETPHLTHCDELLEELKDKVRAMTPEQPTAQRTTT